MRSTLLEEVSCILDNYKREPLIRNAASSVARSYHVTMATKTVNYYKFFLQKAPTLKAVLFGQDPYKNDYCGTMGSAFGYCPKKNKVPPFSCKVLAKSLAHAGSLEEDFYLGILRENHLLALQGVLFLDIFPFPAVKTLLSKRSAYNMSRLDQLRTKYARRLATLVSKFILQLKIPKKLRVQAFLLGNQTQSLFPRFFSEAVSGLHPRLDCFNAHHPAYERWKRGILMSNKNNVCTMEKLAETLKQATAEGKASTTSGLKALSARYEALAL